MTARGSRYLALASAIGDVLCRDALWDGERCTWGGASMEPVDGEWLAVWRTFGPSLYDGTAGVALFLARLHAVTGDPKHSEAAIGGIRQALATEAALPSSVGLSFYAGHLGVAWAAETVGRFCGRPEIESEGVRLALRLRELNPAEAESDVVSGIAGALPALLDLATRQGRAGKAHVEHAIVLGDVLLSRARRHADGAWSWPIADPGQADEHDLVGHSHGAGGIACALLELWKATGDTRFRQAADRGFAYERRWYNAAQGNWPDLRSFRATPRAELSYPVFWCHGAAGIGFCRLRAFALTGDTLLRDEAEIAVETTVRAIDTALDPAGATAVDRNFSLCHGLAGNADLLLYARDAVGAGEKTDNLEARVRAIADFGAARHGGTTRPGGNWPCGVLGGGEAPGLMLGIAGIGHFYLRVHDSAATPTPLVIEPGRRRA